MKFSPKERAGYGILGVLVLVSGLYSAFTGRGGGTAGTSSVHNTGISAILIGIAMTGAGGFLLYKVITHKNEED